MLFFSLLQQNGTLEKISEKLIGLCGKNTFLVPVIIYVVSFLLSAVMDKVMYGLDAGKLTLIITDSPRQVAERIDQLVGRGATFLKAEGSYSGKKKDVVLCACNNKQMYPIRRLVREIDPDAFVIILESNEVLGEGFKRME